MTDEITRYKGFGLDWKCRDFQFEIGKTYEHIGKVNTCVSGFHACDYPLDVFGYYPPGTSHYAVVKQSGEIGRHSDDTKIASAKITIESQISIPDMVTKAVSWVLAQCTPANAKHAEGYRSAASSTGYRSAASSTGYWSAAMSAGYEGKVMGGKEGTALFLVYRDDRYYIKHAWAGIVGKDGIKPDVWYTLNDKGKPVEA